MVKSLLISVLLLNSCVYDPPMNPIFVYNNSDNYIYVYSTCSDSIQARPEIVRYSVPLDSRKYYDDKIPPRKTGRVTFFSNRRESIMACKGGTLKLFIISDSVIESKNWSEIYRYQMYERKVILSANQLEKNNWTYNFE